MEEWATNRVFVRFSCPPNLQFRGEENIPPSLWWVCALVRSQGSSSSALGQGPSWGNVPPAAQPNRRKPHQGGRVGKQKRTESTCGGPTALAFQQAGPRPATDAPERHLPICLSGPNAPERHTPVGLHGPALGQAPLQWKRQTRPDTHRQTDRQTQTDQTGRHRQTGQRQTDRQTSQERRQTSAAPGRGTTP